jgi:zinc protease
MIDAVTLAEVHQAFKENWPDDHRLILITGNADLKAASPKAPESLIRDVYLAAASTVVHRPAAEESAAFPYLPEPENTGTIASREEVKTSASPAFARQRHPAQLKRTDYKTNEVLANLIFGHGKSAEPRNPSGYLHAGRSDGE